MQLMQRKVAANCNRHRGLLLTPSPPLHCFHVTVLALAHLQAKKVAQHLKKHKVTGTGYSNEDNPFGDTNLTERFVWGKKIEKEIAGGRDVRDMTAKAEMKRQAERLVSEGWGHNVCLSVCWRWCGGGQGEGGCGCIHELQPAPHHYPAGSGLQEEIEKVKKRREQREAEKAAMAEELEMIQRERAIAEAADLEKKEEEVRRGRGWAGPGGVYGSAWRVVCSAVVDGRSTAGRRCGSFSLQGPLVHPAWMRLLPATQRPTNQPTLGCPSPLCSSFPLQFHLEQAKAKSQQRLGEGRPKPIDRLAHTIFLMEGADPQEVCCVGRGCLQ